MLNSEPYKRYYGFARNIVYKRKITINKEAIMIVITNNIEKECWNILELYEDYEYVVEKIKRNKPNIKATTVKKIAKEINFYFKQAEELYKASNSSIITNPLTLFYALNNLVRGTYLIKNPTKGISASHGLQINNDPAKEQKLSDIVVQITKSGTFANLNEMLNNNIPVGVEIKLGDILSIIPELSSIYYLTYAEEPNVYLLSKNISKKEFKIILPNCTFSKLQQKNLDLLKQAKVHLTFGKNALGEAAIIYPTMATENFENIIEYDIYQNRYISLGINVDGNLIKMEQLNAIYILFYIYSMEVRYRSYEWLKIIESKEKAIIQKSISELKIKMLICIISLLDDMRYEFTNNNPDYKDDIDYSKLTDNVLSELKSRKIRTNKSPLRELL